MDLLLSEEQTAIVDAIRGFLDEAAPVARLRPPAPQVGNDDAALWPRLGEMGFLGLALPTEAGGSGLSVAEEALACREFGRHLLSPSVLGLMLGCRIAGERDPDVCDLFARGEARVALANPRGAARAGLRISGEFHLIDGAAADWVLWVDATGAALAERAAFGAGERLRATDSALLLERVEAAELPVRHWLPAAEGGIYDRARICLAAYALGLAEATRDMAVGYAKTREQFGKPIGSFQAIKHLCADMAIRAEAALCQVTYASLTVAGQAPGAAFHATAAKLVAVDAALRNAAQNIQVHGAVGFTAEADAHHFLKRSHTIDLLWGDTRAQRGHMLDAAFPD
jgi:alkylation response protein AidB-like acyl-CoA dehydrogenase